MASTDTLGSRIIRSSGEVFRQHHGKPVTFSVSGDVVYLDSANPNLCRGDTEVAANRMPLSGPDSIRDLRGPRYIYAILTDQRIAG